MVRALPFCYLKIINERMLHMNKKEYLLDLYEIELHKKSLYEDGIGTNIPKLNREKEFDVAVKHIAILDELLDLFGKD